MEFSPMRSTEEEYLGFNFKRLLPTDGSVTLLSATVTATLVTGTDADPQGIVDGSAITASPLASQMIKPVGRNGNSYCLLCVGVLSNTEKKHICGTVTIDDDCCADG